MKANLKIYDNGGESYDRYTIIFMDTKSKGIFGDWDYMCIIASEDLKVYTHHFCEDGDHLGKEITFDELPKRIKQTLKDEL